MKLQNSDAVGVTPRGTCLPRMKPGGAGRLTSCIERKYEPVHIETTGDSLTTIMDQNTSKIHVYCKRHNAMQRKDQKHRTRLKDDENANFDGPPDYARQIDKAKVSIPAQEMDVSPSKMTMAIKRRMEYCMFDRNWEYQD
eukprot:scaffold12324_cov144-Cylindrotheca_fusiformis.AAC.3